jgi:WD40 repeat protein
LLEAHRTAVSCLQFQPNSNLLASASLDRTIQLWRVAADGGVSPEYRIPEHAAQLSSLAFSPDGSLLAVGSYDCSVSVHEVESRHRHLVLREHGGEVTAVAFADAEHLLSGDQAGNATCWSMASETRPRRLEGHARSVTAVAFAPDGRTVVSGSEDGTIRFWNAYTGESTGVWEGESNAWVSHLAAAAKAPRLAWESEGSVCWKPMDAGDTTPPRKLASELLWVSGLALSDDGSIIVATGAGGRGVCVWELATGTERPLPKMRGLGETFCVALAPTAARPPSAPPIR